MRRIAGWTGALLWVVGIAGNPQESTDKFELRCKFKRGERITAQMRQKMNVRFDQIPEEYQPIFGDEPLEVTLSGILYLEVKEVAESGSAKLEARVHRIKGKGLALANEFDYDYDADQPRSDPEPAEGEVPGGIDPVNLLHQVATQVIPIQIDPRGKFELQGDSGLPAELLNQFFNLNGLMGELPKEKVGVGDSWKSGQTLTIPGFDQLKIPVTAVNTVEKVAEGDVAEIGTKLSVGTVSDAIEQPEARMYNLKAKLTGEGAGTTHFSLGTGRVRDSKNRATVKILITADDPQGGDPIEFKATLTIEQEHQIVE